MLCCVSPPPTSTHAKPDDALFIAHADELIRQVTIECPERGLLLLRVRDEVKMTIAAYTTLYEVGVV